MDHVQTLPLRSEASLSPAKLTDTFFFLINFCCSIVALQHCVSLCYRAVCCVLCLAAQLCPTLYDPMGYSPPGSSVHGASPGKNTGVGCHALLQGIFPTQVCHIAGRFLTDWATREVQVDQIYICLYPLFFRFHSHLGHHRALSSFLCYRVNSLLVIYFVYSSAYMSITISQSIPLPLPHLVTWSLFSIPVSHFCFENRFMSTIPF